jgi:hypothetical protein
MSVHSARFDPDNDDTFNWHNFAEVTLYTPEHPFPHDVITRENLHKLSALNKRTIKDMNAHAIQKLFGTLPFAPYVKGVANLRNLYAAALECRDVLGLNPSSAARSAPTVHTMRTTPSAAAHTVHTAAASAAAEARMNSLEDTIVRLQAELRGIKRHATDTPHHVMFKQPRAEGQAAVGPRLAHDETTGTLQLEPPKNPLRVLFFHHGAIGYTGAGSTPPSNTTVIQEVTRKMRDLATKIPNDVLTDIINIAWPVDLKHFAEAGMEDIDNDIRHLERALFNFAVVVTYVHGESLGEPVKDFHRHVNSLNGSRWPMPVVRKYLPLCLKHFAGDLQDVYDSWLVGTADADGYISLAIPKIGEDSPTPGVRKKIEALCDDWRKAYNPPAAAPPKPAKTLPAPGVATPAPRVAASRAPKDADGHELCIG